MTAGSNAMPEAKPISTPADLIATLALQARGRCHSCAHNRTYDLPHRSIHYCRAFDVERNAEQYAATRNCGRWAAFRPTDGPARRDRAANNILLADLVAAEDAVFAALNAHLNVIGVDLKTLLVLAQPPIAHVDDLAWVDGLEDRFDIDDLPCLSEVIEELRSLHYRHLCDLLDAIADKFPALKEAPHAR